MLQNAFFNAIKVKSRLFREESGSNVIEFALILPVLAVMLFGVIEMALFMFVSSLVEGGIREATRFGITGQPGTAATRAESILQVLEDHTAGMIDMSKASIDMVIYPSFDEAGQGEKLTDETTAASCNDTFADGKCFVDSNGNGVYDGNASGVGPGGSNEIVLYTFEYDWPLTMGAAVENVLKVLEPSSTFFSDGTIPIAVSVAVRNEPF